MLLKKYMVQKKSSIQNKQKRRLKHLRDKDFQLCLFVLQRHILVLSTDPKLKGVPKGFSVRVRDLRASVGAGFIYPLLGDVPTIPGLTIRPCYYNMEIDPVTLKISGLS